MTKWVCHNCGSKNDIDEEICKGTKPKNANSPGGPCFKKKQHLDKIID